MGASSKVVSSLNSYFIFNAKQILEEINRYVMTEMFTKKRSDFTDLAENIVSVHVQISVFPSELLFSCSSCSGLFSASYFITFLNYFFRYYSERTELMNFKPHRDRPEQNWMERNGSHRWGKVLTLKKKAVRVNKTYVRTFSVQNLKKINWMNCRFPSLARWRRGLCIRLMYLS